MNSEHSTSDFYLKNTPVSSESDDVLISNNNADKPVKSPTSLKRKRIMCKNPYELLFEEELNPTKKNKQLYLDDEVLKARQEEKMKFIKRFVTIFMTYSQYLEKKIEKKSLSQRVLDVKIKTSKEEPVDVTKSLKYFEGGKLHPYQIEGVTWLTVLFENSVNGILADEMGLGKTIQVIALISHLYERKVNGPYLIVAPLSTLGNWEAEFKKFAPKIPCVRLQGPELQREEQMKRIQHGTFLLDNKKVKPVVLCSYQIPHMEDKFLQKFCWTYIIVDEGHRIKNPDCRLSRELRALHSENRLLLTGTPLQNDIKEIWALFNFLMPELFNDIEGFSSLIELDDVRDKNKILENEAQTKIISTIHKVLAPFMLRREKKYVLDDMVPKKEMIIYCPLTELQMYIYKAILKKDLEKLLMKPARNDDMNGPRVMRNKKKVIYNEQMIFKLADISEKGSVGIKTKSHIEVNDENYTYTTLRHITTDEVQTKHNSRKTTSKNVPIDCPNTEYLCKLTMQNITMMLKKVTNHPYLIWCPLDPTVRQNRLYISEDLIKQSGKLMVLDALLPKLKAGKHKVLIFSTLTMFLDLVEEFIILRGYKYRRLDGETHYKERNEYINDFMTDPEIFLFLLSTRAGGLGLNLTAADTVIFLDRDWNPMADVQAQDRCHRIGQTKPVMVYSLIAKNTIDELIVARGDMKKRLEKLVIKEGEFKTLRRNPSDDELKELEYLLENEEESTKIHSNGLFYTDKELNKILDRSKLIEQMQQRAKMKQS